MVFVSFPTILLTSMGGSAFFFVESKTFEFSVKEEDSFYLLHIYRRGWISLGFFLENNTKSQTILLVSTILKLFC